MKFPIRVDAIWRAPLLASGVTQSNSYVTLTDEGVHFRFGVLFNRTVPYSQVANVFPRSWPVLYGIGLRSNLRGVIGLIGSYHDVVEVRLTKRIRNWILLFPCDRISVSLEDPERFVDELAKRAGITAEPVEPLAKPRRRPQKARPAAEVSDGTQPVALAPAGADPSAAGEQPSPELPKTENALLTAASLPGLDAPAGTTSTRGNPARSSPPAGKAARPRTKTAGAKARPAGTKTRAPAQPKGERRASPAPAANGHGAAKAPPRRKTGSPGKTRRRRS
jgi:hypothetical protein